MSDSPPVKFRPIDHWTGRGTVPRDSEGNIVWCNAPGPVHSGRLVTCARVKFHDDDHENGTFKWPREEDE